MEQVLEYIRGQKEAVIEWWLNEVDKEYPLFYNLDKLREHGKLYFDLVTAVHIPVKEHPLFQHLPEWCQILFLKKVPIVHVMHSSHLFRQSVFKALSDAPLDEGKLMKVLAILSERIDTYERQVTQYYTVHAHAQLEDQEQRLGEMHDDKLNLIGKMAASMAHEIRNPLTSIRGFIKLIRDRLPEESLTLVENYIHIIETEFDLIQSQITGFLTFSRKPVEENFVLLNIREQIHSALVLINPLLINNNIELTVDLPHEMMFYVQKTPIQQVISNLLNNSIDALGSVSGERRIWITGAEDEHWITLKITNNGPKIPDGIQHKLFQPFVTGREHGTGLGLAICKKIMDNHQGDISFRSTDNETEFILQFKKKGYGSITF